MSNLLKYMSLMPLLFFPNNILADNTAPIEELLGRMSQLIVDDATEPDSLIARYAELMDSDGRFVDLDYKNQDLAIWEPSYHYSRVLAMSSSYVNRVSIYYSDDDIYYKIIQGLSFWYNLNINSRNWWFNVINEQQKIGETLVLMRFGYKKVPPDLESGLIERMIQKGKSPVDYTGANRTDVALHWVYRGLLKRDPNLLQQAVNYMYEPLEYTVQEGFQVDNSFFQHGNQLYLGGYLELLLVDVLRTSVCMRGTDYELPTERLDILTKYMRETFTDILRGQTMNYNCIGRNVCRKNRLRRNRLYDTFYKMMMILDPLHSGDYEAVRKRIKGNVEADYMIKPKHTHFFRGDYTTHVRPSYSMSVRIASKGAVRCENGNGENEKGYYLSDGSMTISKSGGEYYNIMPLWDWSLIPGTTTPINSSIPQWTLNDKGVSDCCGGVSDSIYGVTSYKYYDTNQKVKTGGCKSWFFFDNEVVCLGAGIQSDYKCVTTIDQCWGKNEYQVCLTNDSSQFYTKGDNLTNNNIKQIIHNNIGYLFPNGGNVWVKLKHKEGNWNTINKGYVTNTSTEGDVFALGVLHNSFPAKYSYVIVPNAELFGEETGNIDIIINSDSIQSVINKALGIVGIVFFRASVLKMGTAQLYVDTPCVMLIKGIRNDSLSIHIANLSLSKKIVKLGIISPQSGKPANYIIDFSLPAPEFTGISKEVIIPNPFRYYYLRSR